MGSGDSKPEPIKILMYGFDNLAKDDLMDCLLKNKEFKAIDSLTCIQTTFIHEKYEYTIWDLFEDQTRRLWKRYTKDVDAFIYLLDNSDFQSVDQAKKELTLALSQDNLKNSIFVIYTNPVKSSYALEEDDLKKSLGVHEVSDDRLRVFSCKDLGIKGFKEGIEWIDKKLGTSLTPEDD